MRTVFNIAKNELRQLFCSPIAWILLVIFYVQTGLKFSETLTGIIRFTSLGLTAREITSQLFSGTWSGIYPAVQAWLYLYIPLLTMGLMNREKTYGTDRLLLSSPISGRQVVLGKFLSMAIYGLVMMSSLIIQIVFCTFTVDHIDIGPVLSGFLGLYLLLLAYSSIGIFMSSLTSYQIIAAVGTVAVLFGMNWLTGVGQEIPILREITYWAGISGRAGTFIRGMICSEDVIYFLAVVSLFLCLTILRQRHEVKSEIRSRKFREYSVVVLVFCAVGFFSSRPYAKFYLDTTATKSNTLTAESQEVMKKLDGPLTITTYVNLLGNDLYTALPRNYTRDVDRFSWYTRFKPEIRMKYVYYWHESESNPLNNKRFAGLDAEGKAKRMAEICRVNYKRFLTPDQIGDFESRLNLKTEDYRFLRVIERGDGSSSRLRMYEDQERHPGEMEITAAMKRLVCDVPKVGILTGHGERDPFGLGDNGYFTFASSYTFRHALVNQGFDVDTVNLSEGGVPKDVSILLIADPKADFSPSEVEEISRYIASGGNVFIAGKPYNRGRLGCIMDQLGLRFIDGTLVQESSSHAPDLIVADIAPDAVRTSPGYAAYIAKKNCTVGIGTMGIDTTGASGRGFHAVAVMTTDSLSTDTTRVWNELQVKDFENDIPVFNPESGERIQNRTPILVSLEREVAEKSQRIIVLGNADMIANGELMMSRKGINAANYSIIMESFRFLSEGEFPIYAPRPSGMDNALRHIDRFSKKPIRWTFGAILPLILLLLGSFIIVSRKSR